MKIKDIIVEAHRNQVESDLNNILMKAKAHGKTELSTIGLVKSLLRLGYTVSVESLLGLLEENPMVDSATTSSVSIATPEHDMSDDQEKEQGERTVQQMATDTAHKEIGM